MKRIILFCELLLIILIGFILSWKSIPDQEGYFETSWNLSHGNEFSEIILSSITPLNHLTVVFLDRILPISLSNTWKFVDLFFGGLTAIFLTLVYWQHQKTESWMEHLKPFLVIISSLGFIYSLTSMTGEGSAVFFAVVGVYFWQQRNFLKATPWFLMSFLAKYTVYLIAPGVVIWTLFQVRKFNNKKFVQLVVSGFLMIGVFLFYHSLKNWRDISAQSSYSTFFSLGEIITNFPPFALALFLGAPLAFLFSLFYPAALNLFWLAGMSSWFVLMQRFFDWHYPVQIIGFWLLYVFTHNEGKRFLSYRFIFLQIGLSLVLSQIMPIRINSNDLFPKHMSTQESKAIEAVIKNEYRGGKVGYYQNRAFDETFPTYEISYMDPSWDFVIEDTEYVVVPKLFLPMQLRNFDHCEYVFYDQLGDNVIYKVNCKK